MHKPYPLFRRLAFFAASQNRVIPLPRALDWLLADAHWWLWSVETEREIMRLIISLAPQLDDAMMEELEQAILSGPPRAMFNKDVEPERWIRIVDRKIWLRLAKIAETGVVLGVAGKERLDALSSQYPGWKLTEDQRDEFPHWMESGWVGDRDPWRTFVSLPRSRRGVMNYLIENPVLEEGKQDDWRERCGDSFQATAYALCRLANQNIWPSNRWSDALQAWADEKLHNRSWQYIAPILVEAPDDLLVSVSHGISGWLRAIAKTFEGYEAHFFTLVHRILGLDHQEVVDSDDPVMRAINHPVGHITEAILRWWYRRPLEDGQGLPEEIKTTFTEICDVGTDKFRSGRVLLATNVITLFRVDQEWATQHLIPLFEWRTSEMEALAAWEGFLGSPRLYRPLMEAFKSSFLDTAGHYTSLDDYGRQYASLLTFAALDPGDTFTNAELAVATRTLPAEGLRDAARALVNALEGAGDQRLNYWSYRVAPYLHAIWPRTSDRRSPDIAEAFSHLCIEAQDAFPDALTLLRGWIQPIEHPYHLLHRLNEGDLCRRFPEQSLEFLALIIGDQSQLLSSDLGACLESIRTVAPELGVDQRFERLMAYLRRHGHP